jgi:aspartate/methionine/tyrosine aminotransferase
MDINATVAGLSEAISIKYNNLVYEMKSAGEDIIVLSLGEAFFDIPRFDFNELAYPDIYHYSHSRGIPELRARIARYYEDEYGVLVNSSSQILVTAGSKIAVYYALQTVLSPGDEVLLLEPFWVSYSEQIKLVGAVPRSLPISTDFSDLESFLSPKTKAVIFNNPQNPTGRNYKKCELEQLYDFAKKNNLYIISDEAYSDFIDPNEDFFSFGLIDQDYERTIIVNSISKNFGISGWRIGYLISCQKIVEAVLRINQHTMTCAPTILLMYLEKYFDEIIQITRPQISLLIEKRSKVLVEIERVGLKVEPGDSTFYFFVSIFPSKLKSIEFCDKLLSDCKVVAIPGIGYGDSCDSHIRISIGTESEERIVTGIERIQTLIEATR